MINSIDLVIEYKVIKNKFENISKNVHSFERNLNLISSERMWKKCVLNEFIKV